MTPFLDNVNELGKGYPELADGLGRSSNLDRALRFLSSFGFAIGEMEVVAQDEFTLDVIFPFNGEQKWLVLGTT